MRAYRSYLSLMARSTLYKELLLFVVVAVVELVLFITRMEALFQATTEYRNRNGDWVSYYAAPVETIVEESRLHWVWLLALLLLSLILIRTAGVWRDYTLDRLGLSRKQGNLLYGLYCTLAFVLLWAFQAALCLGMCLIYSRALPDEAVTLQTVLLSIYRTPLFFTVLPLANGVGWVTNVIIMGALGLCAASGARLQRLGRNPVASMELMVLLALSGFGGVGLTGMGTYAGLIAIAFCFGAVAAARITAWDDQNDREEDPDERLDGEV